MPGTHQDPWVHIKGPMECGVYWTCMGCCGFHGVKWVARTRHKGTPLAHTAFTASNPKLHRSALGATSSEVLLHRYRTGASRRMYQLVHSSWIL